MLLLRKHVFSAFVQEVVIHTAAMVLPGGSTA